MTGMWTGAATLAVGTYSASQAPGGGGGADPGAALWQQKQDQAAADRALRQSRVNRYSNTGSSEWGMQWVPKYDKNGKKVGMEQKPTLTENLNPLLKQSEDVAMQGNLDATKALAARDPFQGPAEIQWDDSAMKDYGDAMYKSVMDRAAPQQEHERALMETRLRQQGLVPGSAAYDRAMKNMLTSQGDVNTQAALQSKISSLEQYRQNFAAQNQAQNQTYGQRSQNYQRPATDASMWSGMVSNSPRPHTPLDNGAMPQTVQGPDWTGMAAQNNYAQQQQNALNGQMWGQAAGQIGKAAGAFFNKPTPYNPYASGGYNPDTGMTMDLRQ